MKDVRFEIFVKSEKSKINFTVILPTLLIVLLIIIIAIFSEKAFEHYKTTAFLFFLLITFLKTRTYFIQTPTYGKIEGHIKFSSNYIQINSTKYLLSEISDINLKINDYVGKIDNTVSLTTGKLSIGVKNSVRIILNTNEIIIVKFRLEKYDFINRKLLIHYHLSNKINFTHLYTVLGLNFEEIQEFKEELKIKREELK